jgi:putative Holliday junction resolvase
MVVLALDYGGRRIGLAVSDALGIAAHALPTLVRRSEEEDVAEIVRLARERKAERIVVGMPLNMDGSAGRQAEEVEAFARVLGQASGLPVEAVDERLTTWEAEEVLKEMGIKARDWPKYVDQLAAKMILTRWLERR